MRHTNSSSKQVGPASRRSRPPASSATSATSSVSDATLDRLEHLLAEVKEQVLERQSHILYYTRELERMQAVFHKLMNLEKEKKRAERMEREEEERAKEALKDRLEILENGPYNLVFHGIETDWMEEEMADDPDFKRDVLEQKMRKILKEDVGMIREIPFVDVFRYYEGPRYKNSAPVVVSFKSRKDKEQIMWRSKAKLKKVGIVLTEDSMARLAKERKKREMEDSMARGKREWRR